MSETRYSWRTWQRPVAATTVGHMVEKIEAKHGACSPRLYVDYARPVDSPTHATLDPWWDDQRAAEEFRVEQARRIIRDLKVIREEREQEGPAFVHITHIPSLPEGGYIATLRAMSDEAMRAQVLRDTMGQLLGLRRRHESLSEFKAVWDAVDDVADQFDGAQPEDG